MVRNLGNFYSRLWRLLKFESRLPSLHVRKICLDSPMSSCDKSAGSIFVHIPKCAGSAMSAFPWCRGSGHATMQDFYNKEQETFESCFKWAFVRNPWDRLASVWSNIFNRFSQFDKPNDVKGWESLINHSDVKETFRKFVDLLFDRREKFQDLDSLRWTRLPDLGLPHNRMHFFPCLSMLKVEGKNRADFVGRFENLQDDWQKVSKRFGNGEKLPVKNSHLSKFGTDYEPSELYDPETIRKVGEIYRDDVEAFGYSFVL